MRTQPREGAPSSAPPIHRVALSQLVNGALRDGYHHLLLETEQSAIIALEVSHDVHAAFLPAFDTTLLTVNELDAHHAFLEFSGVERALLELRAMDNEVLELRVLEW
jgi:uncharacterized protein (DUF927 family)